MGKKLNEDILFHAQMFRNNKTKKEINEVNLQIKLLDENKKQISSIHKINNVLIRESYFYSNLFEKHNLKKYIDKEVEVIACEFKAKDIADKLGIPEKEQSKISFVSARVENECTKTFKNECANWISIGICFNITKEMLSAICPKAGEDEKLLNALNKYCCQYEINTPLRIAHFLSQCGHESGCFKDLEEGISYRESIAIENSCYRNYRDTVGKNIVLKTEILKNPKTWKMEETEICKQPEYFNCKYGAKNGNNKIDEKDLNKKYYYQIEDGYKYRGRGLIQITGREKYQGFTDEHNKKNPNDKQSFIDNPDLVAKDINYTVASACWYWRNKGALSSKFSAKGDINIIVDNAPDDVKLVSQAVNGGEYGKSNGLKERIEFFNKIKKYFQERGIL